MKLLRSKKFTLPIIYFITDRSEIKDLPVGVPFIFGDEESESYIVRLLEYEILYESAIKSGYPFDFRKILQDNGYKIKPFGYCHPAYMEYITQGEINVKKKVDFEGYDASIPLLSEYIQDSAAYVNVDVLKNLNVFPVWLSDVEEAVNVNINNFATVNQHMYNKKLDGMYGGIEMSSPPKNLIIIDISSSIPKAVSSTCLALAKNMSESFYADILITGSKSTLYTYDKVVDLDINTIYQENGMDNDQTWFLGLITEEEREYNSAIVFGDNDHPGKRWNNRFQTDTIYMSDDDGKKLNKWKVKNLVSLHTRNNSKDTKKDTAGYGRWFSPDTVKHIDGWVTYL